MTEKQIEHLKKVLADSKLADNSKDLDQLILKSAHESVQKKRVDGEGKNIGFPLFKFLPISFLRSATLAVVFTIGVFFAMGQLVKVDEPLTVLNSPQPDSRDSVFSDTQEPSAKMLIDRPINLALEPAPSGLSRDQILMNFELSYTEALLAELSFKFKQNTGFDQNNINVAIADIGSLIKVGEFNDARKRYHDLRTECDGCDLPDSLEALVLAAQRFKVEKNPSETG